MICKIDNKEFKNGGQFAKYLKRVYGLTYKEYYHRYVICSDEVPKCKCGCGETTSWFSPMGYREYIKGHAARISNNWGHNQEAQRKSKDTMRTRLKTGEIVIWNKGLTYENSESVRKNIDAAIITKNTLECRKVASDNMKKSWEGGKIVPLMAHDHPQWKGGKSIIQNRIRSNSRLSKEWKYPILCASGFKCAECENTTTLQVHHNGEKFSDIVGKILNGDDATKYTEEQINQKINEIVDYHVINKTSGQVLCRTCHGKIHPSLNFK